MSSPALPLIHQALRKSFQRLESSQKVWASVLAECSPLIASVGNLAEQLRALSSLHLPSTPLNVFPDLEDRLRFKLLHAVDTALVRLNEQMCSLQSVRDSFSNQVSAVFQLYEQNRDSLDASTVMEAISHGSIHLRHDGLAAGCRAPL
ncbi:hypothetical protein fugu_018431 [Takifugu bimaculatus]|uniref:Uncharacterized protein n=1 Tax=Takifugu bimaculatus TaxID=433685 RepID=A0A4Z2BLY0_9TELE|nr:hypothetical protein fugu_018431 [Takifugu bimaculatus]